MIIPYIEAALNLASYEKLDDGTYYGEVPGLDGVYANADTLEDCRRELAEVVEEWVLFRIHRHLAVPPLNNITVKVESVA